MWELLISKYCACRDFDRVDTYKYLGVLFDKRLNWSAHVDYLSRKIRKLIYVFKNLNEILYFCEIRQLYFAYCQSLLLGGIIVWGCACKSILAPLDVVQRSVMKMALRKPKRHPSEELFNLFNVFNIRQLFIKTLLTFLHKNSNSILSILNHSHFTRHSQTVGIRTDRLYKSVSTTNSYYVSQILFRNIPRNLRLFSNYEIKVYKRQITLWLREVGRDYCESAISSEYA